MPAEASLHRTGCYTRGFLVRRYFESEPLLIEQQNLVQDGECAWHIQPIEDKLYTQDSTRHCPALSLDSNWQPGGASGFQIA